MQRRTIIPTKQSVPIERNTTDQTLSLSQVEGILTVSGSSSTLITEYSVADLEEELEVAKKIYETQSQFARKVFFRSDF